MRTALALFAVLALGCSAEGPVPGVDAGASDAPDGDAGCGTDRVLFNGRCVGVTDWDCNGFVCRGSTHCYTVTVDGVLDAVSCRSL